VDIQGDSRGWLSTLPNRPEENVASTSLVALAVIAFAIVCRRFHAPGGQSFVLQLIIAYI
jgi:hypothetical protein